ncbi:MAG TPA: hypothetical protein VGA56_07280, partial [Opitutaceae bacterium]
MPDFIILGAQKAGTTSLYAYLLEHPQVLPARKKEVHYFDLRYERGERWYRSHFPSQRAMQARGRSLGNRVITGEATPYYLFYPRAPERVASVVPNAKFIVLLRD